MTKRKNTRTWPTAETACLIRIGWDGPIASKVLIAKPVLVAARLVRTGRAAWAFLSTLSAAAPILFLLVAGASAVAGLPRTVPERVGMRADVLSRIDAVVAKGLEQGRMPGCVVCIGRRGFIVFRKAYGFRQLLPKKERMTSDTLFDLASLTKPVATATSIMLLVERGQIRLRDEVADHIPEFGQNGKEDITIEQLLTHQGGLIPDNPLADYKDGPEKAMERIFALKPKVEPGTRFIYTDVGFIVLGELVRRVSGRPLDVFAR
ncbi:MAG: beta-lactamase family protein, partial [Planctomycetes bacterium]|nr:beta-lactamase family protein [Planctomycetota bacterium]